MDSTDLSLPWERLESTRQYSGYVRVRRDTCRLPDGSISDWDVLEDHDSVAVVAFTASGGVLLFDQYRVGPGRVLGELPGGAVDAGESMMAAAARELREETGYRASVLFDAGTEWASANSTRRAGMVIAGGCEPVAAPQWSAGEMGRVREIPASALLDHLLAGDLTDAGKALRALHVFARAAGLAGPLADLQRVVRGLLKDDVF